MRTSVLSIIAISFLAGAGLAQTPASAPQPTTQPGAGDVATTQGADPAVVRILDRQEAATAEFNTLTAKLKYFSIQPARKSTVSRDGQVSIMRKPGGGAKGEDIYFFWVHFDNRNTDLFNSDKDEDFAYYNRYLIEISEAGRTVIRREIVPPGKAVNLFRIGEGPFPLPIWQSAKDVLANFDVKLVAPGKGDPANTDRLDLTPKPGTELASKQKLVSIYVSKQTALPVRVVTVSPKADEKVTVDLSDLQPGANLNEESFNLKTPPGYKESVELLGKK